MRQLFPERAPGLADSAQIGSANASAAAWNAG